MARRTAWRLPPPANLWVWDGGHWAGNMVPPIGSAWVPATERVPQVPVAYAAELARSRPAEDWYLMIVARGGTSIAALAGLHYRWLGDRVAPVADAPLAVGTLRFNETATEIAYSRNDLRGDRRFSGRADLGTGDFYPARIETTQDAGACWVDFTATAAATAMKQHLTQPIAILGSSCWPPPEGTEVTVFPSAPRMRAVMRDVIATAFAAADVPIAQQRFDKMLVWPTESDINAPQGFRKDFEWLMGFATERGVHPMTDVLLTLPWPYGAGIDTQRTTWWEAIRDIVRVDPVRRTLVSLEATDAALWGDGNNVHVLDAARETIGTLMRTSEAAGGTPLLPPSEERKVRMGETPPPAGLGRVLTPARRAASVLRGWVRPRG